MKKTYIVYALLTLGSTILAVLFAQVDFRSIIDLPSLALVLGPTVLMLLSHYGPKECINAFRAAMVKNSADERELKNAILFFSTAQTLIIASTVGAVFLGIIMILDLVGKGNAHSANILASWMAIDLISVFYAALGMILVTIPFKSAVQKRLNDIQS